MYWQRVKTLMVARGLRPASLARLAGVSRAAVTKWSREGKKTGWVNAEVNTLRRLARGLGITPDVLLQECDHLSAWKTSFLWDRLYPDMEHFLVAVARGELPALARLVDILGFSQAEKVAGRKILTTFLRYKRFLRPPRREALEKLWPLYQHSTRNH